MGFLLEGMPPEALQPSAWIKKLWRMDTMTSLTWMPPRERLWATGSSSSRVSTSHLVFLQDFSTVPLGDLTGRGTEFAWWICVLNWRYYEPNLAILSSYKTRLPIAPISQVLLLSKELDLLQLKRCSAVLCVRRAALLKKIIIIYCSSLLVNIF